MKRNNSVDTCKVFGKQILIDANLLLLYLIGQYDLLEIEKCKKLSNFCKEDFKLLTQFISEYSKIVTTPHILTEICNLANYYKGTKRDEIFSEIQNIIPNFLEKSETSELLVIGEPFIKFGLADTAILKWIKKIRHEIGQK